MARDTRTLKLSILADVDDLKKKLGDADNAVEQNSSKISEFGKKAALAFAAVGAAVGAYAVSAIKAAAEDQASQVRLQNALRNTVGATDEAIDAAERYIAQQSLATGVTDDQLRPALERLTRSTKDIAEAQKLTNLALDIAAAKNIDVTTVANALAKANDGQTNALRKLGITLGDNATNLAEYNKLQKSLEKAQLDANFALEEYGPKSEQYIKASAKVADITQKANDVAMQGIDIFGELGEEFAGAASEAANTFEGQMARLKVGLDEAKESLGAALLPTVQNFIAFLNDTGIPTLNAFIAGLTGDEGVSASLTETQKNAESFGKAISAVAGIISGFITFIREAIGLVVSLANELIRVVNIIPGVNIGSIPNPAPSAARPSVPSVPQVPTSRTSSQTYTTGQGVTNITVNAIDSEGAARAVSRAINQSAARSNPYLSRAAVKK
jgi:hypothetical protein